MTRAIKIDDSDYEILKGMWDGADDSFAKIVKRVLNPKKSKKKS